MDKKHAKGNICLIQVSTELGENQHINEKAGKNKNKTKTNKNKS